MTKKLRGFVFHVNGNSIEVKLTMECIDACAHRGACDDGVNYWVEQLRPYLDEIPPELIAACLKPYGAWNEEELQDHEVNLTRFIWCAAGNAKDERTQGAKWNNCRADMEAY